jgi:hypothetical protein
MPNVVLWVSTLSCLDNRGVVPMIMKHTFADNNLTDRLRVVPGPGQRPFYRFTLDDLDELAGYVAAEATTQK